jgi:hypothetical protein
MRLHFGLCARGLAIAAAAVFLSGCTSFSTFFQSETASLEDQTSKQQRLGTIQLRVAKTALAHRDYDAALGLFEDAADNRAIRQTALLHLGKLHSLTGNRQAELSTYRTLLKEYPDHAAARKRLAALSAQTITKPAKRPQITAPKSPRAQSPPSHINVRSKVSDVIEAQTTSTPMPPIRKAEVKITNQKHYVKKKNSENEFTRRQGDAKAIKGGEKRPSMGAVTMRQDSGKLFRVQLAAYRYKSNAVRALAHFNKTIAPTVNMFALLTRHERSIDQNGIHYRIRTKSMITGSEAENICKQVRSTGQNCLVIMHNQTMWRSSA